MTYSNNSSREPDGRKQETVAHTDFLFPHKTQNILFTVASANYTETVRICEFSIKSMILRRIHAIFPPFFSQAQKHAFKFTKDTGQWVGCKTNSLLERFFFQPSLSFEKILL